MVMRSRGLTLSMNPMVPSSLSTTLPIRRAGSMLSLTDTDMPLTLSTLLTTNFNLL
jgi:hypothetical protein